MVVVLAAGLTVTLYSLPKVLVNNKQAAVQTASDTDVPAQTAHATQLTASQQVAVNELRNKYLVSTDTEKKIKFADSLSVLYREAAQFDSAAYFREEIVKLSPGVPTWLQAADAYYDAFNFALNTESAKGLGEKTREFYQQVLAKDSNQLAAKANLAMTYATTANPMQGIALLREVLAKDPENVPALFNLGILSMQSRQYDKAISRFEQVLAVDSANYQAQVYLGISYAESGQKPVAKQWLERAKAATADPVIQATIDDYLKKIK